MLIQLFINPHLDFQLCRCQRHFQCYSFQLPRVLKVSQRHQSLKTDQDLKAEATQLGRRKELQAPNNIETQ